MCVGKFLTPKPSLFSHIWSVHTQWQWLACSPNLSFAKAETEWEINLDNRLDVAMASLGVFFLWKIVF